ncbi:MAG: hypothetical protein WCL44_07430 [bacterium]
MRLIVANTDRSADLGQQVSAAAKTMVASVPKDELPGVTGVLSLRSVKTEAEYMDKLTTLLVERSGVAAVDFHVPRKQGVMGAVSAAVKTFLWKVLRYQHDRMAFQQNCVNFQLTASVEFLRAEYERKIKALEQRVAELEKKDR